MVKVRPTMEKAFWNGITDSIREDNYDRVVELMKEMKDELCEMALQSSKQEITETIDVLILSHLLNTGSLHMEYLGKIMEFALISLQKLSAPASENNLKEAHQKVLQELADVLKQEISSVRIKIMEPLIKGPAGLEYLGKAFTERFGQPSDALTRLPLTLRWLSNFIFVRNVFCYHQKGTVVDKVTEVHLNDWAHLMELLAVCEGIERASQTLSAVTRLKEGCHINRSLLTLGALIRKFRNLKL
ncbi:hypothetical protein L2E82_24891 [Cichorium intybus]|uniref:Uncharacterized protein n=1 Tax=Cichorium intybus TaxID=13427 RepID=A0ACB9E210_CICIN|nr:hypothetical protein L2E82_24891 [Cichorium intybus]